MSGQGPGSRLIRLRRYKTRYMLVASMANADWNCAHPAASHVSIQLHMNVSKLSICNYSTTNHWKTMQRNS